MGRHAASPAAAERAELCTLLLEVGESAPTLSGDWDAADLAAHLVARETRPDAVLGLVIPPLREYTATIERETRHRHSYRQLVEILRSGPSWRTPLGWPGVRNRANVHEFFLHHEDVRRAQPGWTARQLSPELSAALWNLTRTFAPLLLHGIKATRVTLRTPGGGERSVGPAAAPNSVTVTGEPGELLMYLSGRRGAAEVSVSGSPAGQARLAAAPLAL